MGRQRTHVQQTLRPKPRPRPYARSGFVSFSGVGSVIPRVEQNANTSRVPYNYTNTQKWYTFLTNGRPKFHKNCLLFCDVIFESGSCSFWEESHSHLPGRHAEVKALRHISTKEQETDTNARFVMFYLSYSPCANCANFILDFSGSRPQCHLSLGFSCLFRHEEELHRDGLRRLNAALRIVLGVFTNLEWKRLADATGISFRYNSPRRHAWDLKWKAEFENILKEEARNTTLGPSVPSEERYKSSVVIPAIHFLQDQGWTSGGSARSSGLSQGRFSRTSLERCRERQEWGLNAVAVEIPEGNRAVNRRAKSLSACCVILIVLIVVILGVGLYYTIF